LERITVSVARELFFDLPVPKKLVAILWIFLIVVILLLGLGYLTIENLSAARAYVGGEGLWSKAQKQAVRELLLYSSSRLETHFDAYRRALLVPLGDRPSGVTAKPANGGHFKTGQRKWPGTRLFYSDAS
jgi:asparagine N-glycosylation enzyme membrane subunit Stt3